MLQARKYRRIQNPWRILLFISYCILLYHTVDSHKLEYGPRTSYAGVPSFCCFKFRGRSVINTDCGACRTWVGPTLDSTKAYSEGPSTQYLRTLVPKSTTLMVFGTRVLKYWVLGPSGYKQVHGVSVDLYSALYKNVYQGNERPEPTMNGVLALEPTQLLVVDTKPQP